MSESLDDMSVAELKELRGELEAEIQLMKDQDKSSDKIQPMYGLSEGSRTGRTRLAGVAFFCSFFSPIFYFYFYFSVLFIDDACDPFPCVPHLPFVPCRYDRYVKVTVFVLLKQVEERTEKRAKLNDTQLGVEKMNLESGIKRAKQVGLDRAHIRPLEKRLAEVESLLAANESAASASASSASVSSASTTGRANV